MKLIRKKLKPLRWWQNFSHFKSMGAICCHGNQSSNLICLKTLCSLSPYLIMVHKKFDQDRPTGSRDILHWKCGGWRRMMKTLCSLSPYLIMVHKKFDQDRPTGSRDIFVESVDDDDGWQRRTTDHTILIPHRSLWLRWAKNNCNKLNPPTVAKLLTTRSI